MKSNGLTFGEFLSDRLGRYVFQTIFYILTVIFLYLTGTECGILTLVSGIWLLVFAGIVLYDFWRCHNRLQELEGIMDRLDKKYLFAECISKPGDAYERRLLELSKKAGRAMIREVSDVRAAWQEYREYVESWVHEVKTPITAAELICRNADEDTRRKLSVELAQIEAHIERALFYARAESPEKDLLVRKTSLVEIVKEALGRHQALLIQSGVSVETEALEQVVYTDKKWAVFILGQLLQNAVRYRMDSPCIFIRAKQTGQQTLLIVEDNGMGIASHELPRVFERGFTGSNGRLRGGSTGMGLYLCRKLGTSLEMGVEITSQEGRGTKVILTFPAKELQKCKTDQ